MRGQGCGVRATIRVRIRDCGRLRLRPIQGGKIHAAIKLPELHVARGDRSPPFSASLGLCGSVKKLAMFVGQGATNERGTTSTRPLWHRRHRPESGAARACCAEQASQKRKAGDAAEAAGPLSVIGKKKSSIYQSDNSLEGCVIINFLLRSSSLVGNRNFWGSRRATESRAAHIALQTVAIGHPNCCSTARMLLRIHQQHQQ